MPFSHPETLLPFLSSNVSLHALEHILSPDQVLLITRMDGSSTLRTLATLSGKTIEVIVDEVKSLLEQGIIELFQRNMSDELVKIDWRNVSNRASDTMRLSIDEIQKAAKVRLAEMEEKPKPRQKLSWFEEVVEPKKRETPPDSFGSQGPWIARTSSHEYATPGVAHQSAQVRLSGNASSSSFDAGSAPPQSFWSRRTPNAPSRDELRAVPAMMGSEMSGRPTPRQGQPAPSRGESRAMTMTRGAEVFGRPTPRRGQPAIVRDDPRGVQGAVREADIPWRPARGREQNGLPSSESRVAPAMRGNETPWRPARGREQNGLPGSESRVAPAMRGNEMPWEQVPGRALEGGRPQSHTRGRAGQIPHSSPQHPQRQHSQTPPCSQHGVPPRPQEHHPRTPYPQGHHPQTPYPQGHHPRTPYPQGYHSQGPPPGPPRYSQPPRSDTPRHGVGTGDLGTSFQQTPPISFHTLSEGEGQGPWRSTLNSRSTEPPPWQGSGSPVGQPAQAAVFPPPREQVRATTPQPSRPSQQVFRESPHTAMETRPIKREVQPPMGVSRLAANPDPEVDEAPNSEPRLFPKE